MTGDELLNRISVRSARLLWSTLHQRATHLVSLILDLLASGTPVETVMQDYDLERADVMACIAYGAR